MTTIDQQIRELERDYREAIQHRDATAAMRLSDDRCVVVGARGYQLAHAELADQTFRVRSLTDDVAIVAYEIREDIVVVAYEASVWVRRGDTWLCALHTESRDGPFGRRDVRYPESRL